MFCLWVQKLLIRLFYLACLLNLQLFYFLQQLEYYIFLALLIKTVFLKSDSTRTIFLYPIIPSIMPGKPAPDPISKKSFHLLLIKLASWPQSKMCLVHGSLKVEEPTKFSFSCQSERRFRYLSKTKHCFT